MREFGAILPRSLSARIILRTVFFVALLLAASVFSMTIGTRLIIREETGRQAGQALDGLAYRIDNILLGVEQTATIIKTDIPRYLDNPQKLLDLCRSTLEADSHIAGCAIALNPDFFTVRGEPFMAYIHRAYEEVSSANGSKTRPYITAETFTSLPFTEQEWYTKPLREGVPFWIGPLKNDRTEAEPILSYDVPITLGGQVAGVLGVDVSLPVLTEMVRQFRTSPHTTVMLINREGSFIVYPESAKLFHVESLSDLGDGEDEHVMAALRKMVLGKSGSVRFTLGDTPSYMAYTPFRQEAYPGRQVEDLGWSIAVIYPQRDLFEKYDPFFNRSILIILAGILFVLVGGVAIARVYLKPLRRLTSITRLIAKGNYTLPALETDRTDEIGQLHTHYSQMVKAISGQLEQLQSLSQSEEARQKDLAETYARTRKIEKHRSTFFSNMTHQMADAAGEIQASVDRIREDDGKTEENRQRQVLDQIEKAGLRITDILNEMLNTLN